jgi:hypothetical protein
VDALAERILHLYQHRELLPKLGARACQAVRRLTPDAFRKPLLERLKELA